MAYFGARARHLDIAAAPDSARHKQDRPTRIRTLASLVMLSCVWFGLANLTGCGVVFNDLPLSVNPSDVTFGSVPVGQSQRTSITLHNSGLKGIMLNSVAADNAAFAVTPGALPVQIAAGSDATVAVTFTPATTTDYKSTIAVVTGAGSTKVAVSGSGTSSPAATPVNKSLQTSASTIDFGAQTVGSQSQQTLVLTSTGTAPVDISAVKTNDPSFSITGLTLPVSLQPGQTLTLPILFHPTTIGAVSAQVSLKSDATSPVSAVALTGSGIASALPAPPPSDTPSLTLSATQISFGSVSIGGSADASLTLTSNGTAPVVLSSLQLAGTGFSVDPVALPAMLAVGQSLSLGLHFSPSSAGSAEGSLTLSDNVAGSPQVINLKGEAKSTQRRAVSVSPGSLDFGSVTTGSTATKTITLVSTGNQAVTIDALTASGSGFSLAPQTLPIVLQPGQQVSVSLTLDPVSTGSQTGDLSIHSNDSNTPSVQVPLTGRGVAPTVPSLSVSENTLSFGQQTVGSEAGLNLTVTSTGTAPAQITGGTVSGAEFQATYAGVPVQSLSAPIVLQPGQQATFRVAFAPTTTGAVQGQLSLATDTGSPLQVTLSGDGQAAPVANLTLSTAALNFGNVQQGKTGTASVTLTSSGTAPLTLSNISVAGASFQVANVTYPSGISGFPAILQPGQAVVLQMAFAPTAVGAASGSVLITDDASGGSQSVSLSGTGTAVPVPGLAASSTALNFGSVTVGSSSALSLTLTSNGTAPVTIMNLALNAPFSIAPTTLPVQLQPGQQLALQVTFSPQAAGGDTAELTVNSDASSGPLLVSLGGTGVAASVPVLQVNSTSLAFGQVVVGQSASRTLVISNTGQAPLTIDTLLATGGAFQLSAPTLPVTVQAGQQLSLNVVFAPTAPGNSAGSIAISSNGGNATVSLSGSGVAATVPLLAVSTNALPLGSVTVGSSGTSTLSVSNTGTAALTIQSIVETGAEFQASPAGPLTLQPGQQATVQVRFAPTAAGGVTGSIVVTSNGGNATVSLSGRGVVATVPVLGTSTTSLQFGSVNVGSHSSATVTLANTGTAALTIQSIAETGAGFQASPAGPITLQPGQQATVQVTFAPTAAGAATGSIAITSNGGSATISLSGSGTAVQHEADLTWDPPATSADPVVGYNVYRATTAGGTPVRLNSAPIDLASYADKAVTSGATYYYLVRSVDASGQESSSSNELNLTIP